VVDDLVVGLKRSPYVRLLQVGADVKPGIVPEEFGPRAKARPRPGLALYVYKIVGPRRGAPSRFIQAAVDLDWTGGAIAVIAPRRRPCEPPGPAGPTVGDSAHG